MVTCLLEYFLVVDEYGAKMATLIATLDQRLFQYERHLSFLTMASSVALRLHVVKRWSRDRLHPGLLCYVLSRSHISFSMVDLEPKIDGMGNRNWFKNGKLHRDGDMPALVSISGLQAWYKDGKLHRDNDMPAIVHVNGDKEWVKDGYWHRDGDLPAIVYASGAMEWYTNGKRHRDGDLPAVVNVTGSRSWYKDGKRHRDVGPAYISIVASASYFYTRGVVRTSQSILGETILRYPMASWSPVLCFI